MSNLESQDFFTLNGTYKAINVIISKVGDFTPFYIAITICSVILGFLVILNIACCCSKFSEYWLDRHTGNRWIVSIWSATPHKQPPLDLTELEEPQQKPPPPVQYIRTFQSPYSGYPKESDVPPSVSQQPLASQEYEMHKRESDL